MKEENHKKTARCEMKYYRELKQKKNIIIQPDTIHEEKDGGNENETNHDLPILRPPNTEAAAGVRANALGREID